MVYLSHSLRDDPDRETTVSGMPEVELAQLNGVHFATEGKGTVYHTSF